MAEKEYIEREAAMEEINFVRSLIAKTESPWLHGYASGLGAAIDTLAYLQPSDVVEAKHGRWLLDGRCSECLETPLTSHKKYCPNCGAKMDLEG